MITIIDFGMGNIGSIKNMLKKIGVESIITSKAENIQKATSLILPGIGSFDQAMKNLNELEIVPVIRDRVLNHNVPILGICLGMQLLANSSDEGVEEGLKLIDGVNKKFNSTQNNLKIPHMGWNTVDIKKENKILELNEEEKRFYFVHSYYFHCNNEEDVLTSTEYGIEFCSSVSKDNIFGVQFHPEKSHKFGMRLLKNFSEL